MAKKKVQSRKPRVDKPVAPATVEVKPEFPVKVASGYYYQFGETYRVEKPGEILPLVSGGRLMRLEAGLYRVMRNFIYNKVIGEKYETA